MKPRVLNNTPKEPQMTDFGPPTRVRGPDPDSIFENLISMFLAVSAQSTISVGRGLKNEYENTHFHPQRTKRGPIFGGVGLFGPKTDFLLCDIHA